jgi:hypothetical protein
MAEFQLNKIRFTWKGPWVSGSDYVVDDMVEYEGKTYVAKRVHTAGTFSNDIEGADVTPATPKWELQTDGAVWKGNWTTSTTYSEGAIVKYGSGIYQCIEEHVSSATFSSGTDGLIEDITKWKVVAVSDTDWKYNWSTNTLYRRNDIVRYNGRVYKALEQHISASTNAVGLEGNQSNWSVLADGDSWRGTWGIGTRYRTNDIVKYGGIVYRCTIGHTSADNNTIGLEQDQGKWEILVDGTEYRSDWMDGFKYRVNDVVKRGANLVKCITAHVSQEEFTADAEKWELFMPGEEYEGQWEDGTRYQPGDLVRYGGYVYKSITYNTSTIPSTNPSDWDLNLVAYRFRGDWNTSGEDSAFVEYLTGDVVRFSGNVYLAITDNFNQQPDLHPLAWEILSDGRQFRNIWEDNVEYYPGDIVTWQGTSYIALKYHRSTESDSRPDLDVNNTDDAYWKYMIKGTLTNKLARVGDIKTFEDQDSTAVDTQRVPIGTTGQALRSTSGLPAWDSLDKQNEVYYVATHGIDDESQGGTLNAPFRTVRFACNYILRDEKNRSGLRDRYFEVATDLMTKNIDFVKDETTAWIDSQIAADTGIWAEFTFDDTKCTRDLTNILTDVAYDVALGTNYNGVFNALAYMRPNNAYNIQEQREETIGGIQYAQSLIQPSISDSTSLTRFNTAFTEIVDAINGPVALSVPGDGVTSALVLPAPTGVDQNKIDAKDLLQANIDFIKWDVLAYIQNNFVELEYNSEKCARDVEHIINALSYDVLYGGTMAASRIAESYFVDGDTQIYGQSVETAAAYTHMKSLVQLIIQESAITAQSGNPYTVTTTGSPASATEAAELANNMDIIIDVIQAGTVSGLPVVVYPDITWAASAQQTDKAAIDSARSAAITNTITYIGDTYDFKYDKAKCARDVAIIVANVVQDMTYTGNQLSRLSAERYWNGAESYVLGQQDQTVAALNFARDLINDYVIENVEYSSIQGKSAQYTNAFAAESGAAERVTELMGIITDVIENGLGNLPALVPTPKRGGATIRVMTGDYAEILPIIVPEDVAIVGDELRSTTIRPAVQGRDVVLSERTNIHGIIQPQLELTIPTDNNEHDMFYVRNGCGIRQLSLKGLTGQLLDANDYGTRRPTGGAYVSLDPGEGPDDQRVWVRNKSTYVQGVTTLGDNCVGMKIDGALHNGGNKSCVANDFTQVLSDGIGYWAANGGRSELVSVFTYYAHIGYLAEEGGILRATNGNNSYGTFGSVAEGFDRTEVPISAEVNNQSKEAQVESTYTDTNEVMAFGYSNAGQGYSTVSIDSINSAGLNLDVEWEEFRDNAISDLRILKPDDSSTAGGAGYKFITNFAQSGGVSNIFLAQSEERLPSQVVGMRVYITSGKGVGQYGWIQAYNNLTKEATVYRESTNTPGWDHIIGATQIELQLDETTKYEIEPRVSVEEPDWTSSGITTRAGAGIMGYAGGNFYYPLSGTNDVEVSTNSGETWTTYQLANSATWSAVAKSGPMMLLTSQGSSTLHYSNEGTLWDNTGLGTSQDWTGIAVGGRDNDTVILCATGWDNVLVGTITVGEDSSIAPQTWSTVSLPASRDWVDITYGAGLWIVISSDGYTVYSQDNGANWTGGLLPAPASPEVYNEIVWGNNSFVATMNNADRIFYSPDGVNWLDSDLVGDSTRQDWSVAYAAGVFVAVSENGSFLTSDDSANWIQRTDLAAGGSVAGGVEAGQPTWLTKDSTTTGVRITGGKRAVMRVTVANNNLDTFIVLDPGSGYATTPIVTITDPEEYIEPLFQVNLNDGVLTQPSFYNRGTGYITAITTLTGDGLADIYQLGQNLVLKNVSKLPGPGANLRLASQPDTIYRVVLVQESSGVEPNLDVTVRVSPLLAIDTSPDHEEAVTLRENFSQVRLTGHDFLDIGTGNFQDTNYPELYVFGREAVNETRQANEVVEANGGRVFYTSTDQDGNFRVGELFRVAQASGGVTLNADFFDLEGLDELRLGGIQVGGTQATIREFSTDNTMTANSDSIIPTQRAIGEYLENRITGGGATLFTNKITAGVVFATNNEISTTEGIVNFNGPTNFEGGVDGDALANALFMAARTSQDDFNG